MTIAATPDQGEEYRRPSRPVSFDRASWRESAACRRMDTEIFFPISRTGLGLLDVQEAKEVCSRCPVRLSCLAFALDTQQGYGIWGGCDEEERRLLLRQRRSRAADNFSGFSDEPRGGARMAPEQPLS